MYEFCMNKSMKFIQKHWLPILLAIAILTSIILSSSPSNKTIENNEPKNAESVVVPQCYLYEEPVDIELAGENVNATNLEFIEISIDKKGIVSGHHHIVPYGIDSNAAYFVGITQSGFINVVATATAEGETWQEQRVYKVNPDKLLVGYQEVFVPQYKSENGVYLYEDLNKIKFETEKFFLSRVDCETVDRSKF